VSRANELGGYRKADSPVEATRRSQNVYGDEFERTKGMARKAKAPAERLLAVAARRAKLALDDHRIRAESSRTARFPCRERTSQR